MIAPSFAEIFEEAHRLAIEHRVPEIASFIQQDKPPTPRHEALYDALLERAYRNLVPQAIDKEWAIMQVTKP